MIQSTKISHIISFDVEEYFHCEVYRSVIAPEDRKNWPSRIDCQLEKLLRLLDDSSVKATFFILGDLAKKRPDIVRLIDSCSHEIACHGQSHEMIQRLGPEGFKNDTKQGRDTLGDITGKEILGYRAATFGLVRETAWAIDILSELGFKYDSSVQPVMHDRYGVPDAPRAAHIATGPAGGEILEIPPMTARLAGKNIPLGGGGYFRLFPTFLFDRSLKRWAARQTPAMLYLHPWEFDAGQPSPPIGLVSRFRHRVNLSRTAVKLDAIFKNHSFTTAQNMLNELNSIASNEKFSYA